MKQSPNKRKAGTAGVKALIASASVAATLAGWAILPFNDPSAASGASQVTDQQPAVTAPFENTPTGSNNSLTVPSEQSPGSDLPQVQSPQNTFGRGRGFTNTHSSR